MSSTLFKEILRLARTAGLVREGLATGGTTTTLTDANQKITTGSFPGGTIFFLSGNNASVSRLIKNYTGSEFTFLVLSSALAIAAGDRYAVADKVYPRDLLIQAVNEALRSQYPQPFESLTVGGLPLLTQINVDEYTIDAGTVLRVEVATSATVPYNYEINQHWVQAGTKLRFDPGFAPFTAGLKMRLTYAQVFTDLVNDADAIPDTIDLDYLHWQAVVELCRKGLLLYENNPEHQLTNILNEAYAQLQRLNKPAHPQPDVRLAGW